MFQIHLKNKDKNVHGNKTILHRRLNSQYMMSHKTLGIQRSRKLEKSWHKIYMDVRIRRQS